MGGRPWCGAYARASLAAAIVACLFVVPANAGRIEGGRSRSGIALYVAPWGNDHNSGTQALPLKTFEGAQDTVRARNRTMTQDITVYLEQGTYRLSHAWRLTPRDSGRNGHDVVWTAPSGETSVISGAKRISNWTLSDPSKNIWSAPVPPSLRTRQIYVNGMRASLAAGPSPVKLKRIWKGYVATSPLMAHWRNPTNIDFVYRGQLGYYAEPICPVGSIAGKTITMAQPCWNNSNHRSSNLVAWNGITLGIPTYVENAYELLDQPGEFYLDQSTHQLYYIPRKGQHMSTADVEAPVLETLVLGGGTGSAPIHNITFANLQFSYATWMQPSSRNGFSEQQAGYMISGAHGAATEGLCTLVPHGTCPYGAWTKEPGNIQFSFDRHISFVNDRFVHLGAAGLNLDNGSQDDSVRECVFTDISGNGLELGNVNMPEGTGASQTINDTVINNHLYGLPAEYHGGVAVLAGYVANTTISHNQIDHTPWVPISIGWGGWLDKLRLPPVPNFSHDNVVSSNRIFDFMEVMKDGGGIYTQGIQGSSLKSGLKVTGNVVHDQLDWGAALKSDDGATYLTYSGNVLYNDTYDWANPEYDYRSDPGKPSHSYNPQVIEANWWQQGYPDYFNKGIRFARNMIISGASQVPAGVLTNAGIQKRFSALLSWRPAGRTVPTSPQVVSTLYAYDGTAYVTWHPSYAAGNSRVTSYTLHACRLGISSNLGECALGVIDRVTVSASDFERLGYAAIGGLTDGQSYGVTVTANSATGSSIPSLPTLVSPVGHPPNRPDRPTHLYAQTGQGNVTLLWYRPKNDGSVHVLVASGARRRQGALAANIEHAFVLRYLITSSTGAKYPLNGQEQLIATNTGSRVLKVIGGLVRGHRYRFSVSAVGPTGSGPAARTGWVVVQ